MNARRLALVVIVALALLVFTVSATSEPQQSIIVNGADEIVENPVGADPDLIDIIAPAGPRVVVEYANHVGRMDLVTVPPPLATRLNQVTARVAVQYANDVAHKEIDAVPAGLQARLAQVAERVVFAYANSNRQYALAYPRDLVNDTTPPVVSEIGIGQIADNGVLTVTWTTDEFADSTILYGTAPGSYPHMLTDPLYVKDHALGLTNLTAGTTYYYSLRSVDLSGNVKTTVERTFVARRSVHVYLPVVLRSGP